MNTSLPFAGFPAKAAFCARMEGHGSSIDATTMKIAAKVLFN
jgi:hypothetical protein